MSENQTKVLTLYETLNKAQTYKGKKSVSKIRTMVKEARYTFCKER